MENKAHALAAGLFVALLSLLVLAVAAWLTRDTGVRHAYEISTKETVTGLQAQAPVRFRGVDVGKVSRIGFDPKTTGNVLVRMEIDTDAPLTQDTFATLGYQGVTGLAFVQLADEGRPSPALVPDDEAPPRIPLRPGLLQKLEDKGEAILERVEEMSNRVNRVLSDDNQRRIATALDNIGRTAESADRLAIHMDRTLTQRLEPALSEATVTLRGMRRTADQVGAAATQFGEVAQRLNAQGGPMDRLSDGTDALVQAAESLSAGTLPRINRAAEETSQTMQTLDRAINELTDNPQALLFGGGKPRPGPGEPGFQPPGVRP